MDSGDLFVYPGRVRNGYHVKGFDGIWRKVAVNQVKFESLN
ncbi:MAG: hypothetical protein QOH25_2479 [Acidobacteriota bacterium]|jgi:hypothetical protein|nr:hypothetical protein [Acidobacteriota bacterium]